MLSVKSVFSKNNLTLNLFRKNVIIGCINTYIRNIPIINEHYMDDKFKNLGYGSILLQENEKLLAKNYDQIDLNLWCKDQCYLNYLNYYSKRNYILTDKKNIDIIDNGDKIFYNVNLKKYI
tara:strand:- start:12 stop:374 length:363 start_codon:yes stop_codon:yes gene_type:complete